MIERRLLLLSLLFAPLACGDDDPGLLPDGGTADAAPPDAPAGMAISAPANTWTWVDFPAAACDDGSATGIGVNLSPASANVVIFFNGGGACWDYLTCAVLNTSTHGPVGKTQFDALAPSLGGIFSRSSPMNPFADWNMVWVPYCTGDIHGGSNVVTYTQSGGTATRTIHHLGHQNVLAYLERLAPTFPAPAKLVITGASAGGFGAALNYLTVREALRPAKSYLIDDSGPLLGAEAITAPLREAFYTSWDLGVVTDPLCGQACRTDFSAGLTALSTRYPSDRLALLSSLRDQVIRAYLLLSAESFEAALVDLATSVLDETANFKYFLVTGESHTMLGSPDSFTSNGTSLWDWLTGVVEDGTFMSTRP